MSIGGTHEEEHLNLKNIQLKAADVSVKCGYKQLKLQYKIGKKCGEGAYGEVFRGYDKKNPKHEVAIKIIDKINFTEETEKVFKEEINIMFKLDHPNIVKFFETYESQTHLYLVVEFCPGGELFDSDNPTSLLK